MLYDLLVIHEFYGINIQAMNAAEFHKEANKLLFVQGNFDIDNVNSINMPKHLPNE